MIWLVFALLTGAAVMAVLVPLALRGAARDPGAADVAFFEEQIAEIARERDEGRLDPEEAEGARAEAARRLLRAQSAVRGQGGGSRRTAVIAALAAIVLIPAVSIPLYLHLGAANLPDMPLEARLGTTPEKGDLAGAVARIEQHLREHPEDGRGFEVVAPYYLRAGRGEDAIDAYEKALKLLGPTAQRYVSLGQARLVVGEGKMTPEAKKDFEAALAIDPQDVGARYYLALGAAQAGEKDKAIELFSRLEAEAPADAAYLGSVRARLADLRGTPAETPAASGPDSAQGKAIAAMPAQDRQAMIRSMVDRLATRLQSNGDDVDGWLKLIRAYSVLAEPAKAKEAVANARKALAGKGREAARIDALAKELNIGG
jgi:cytochrome c-type biogenesis protein CcmH